MDLEYKEGILTIYLGGKLDFTTTYKIYNYLNKILIREQKKIVIFNLDKLEKITIDGIDALSKSINIVKKYKGVVYLDKVKKNNSLKLKKLHLPIIKRRDYDEYG